MGRGEVGLSVGKAQPHEQTTRERAADRLQAKTGAGPSLQARTLGSKYEG